MSIELLFEAIKKGDFQQVRNLLKLPEIHSNINVTNKDGNTPLLLSAAEISAGFPYLGIFNALMQNGANPNDADNKGNTPLMMAINQRKLIFFKKLIKHEVNLEQTNQDGNSALSLAIKSKINIEISSHFDSPPLICNQSLLHLVKNGNGFTCSSICKGDNVRIKILKILINKGINISSNHVQPVLIAVKSFNQIIKEIESTTENKIINLDYHYQEDYYQAFLQPHLEIIKLLAINGANLATDDEPLVDQIDDLIDSARAADQLLDDPTAKVSIINENIFEEQYKQYLIKFEFPVFITDTNVFEERYKYFLNKNGFNGDYSSYINKLKENKTIPEISKNKIINKLSAEQDDFNLNCDSLLAYIYGGSPAPLNDLFNFKKEGCDFAEDNNSNAKADIKARFHIYNEIDPDLVTKLKEYFFENVLLTDGEIKDLKGRITSANIKLLTDNCVQIFDQLFADKKFSDIEAILNLILPSSLKSILPQIYQENCQKFYAEIIHKDGFKIEDTKGLILTEGVVKLFEANYPKFEDIYYADEQGPELVIREPDPIVITKPEIENAGDVFPDLAE